VCYDSRSAVLAGMVVWSVITCRLIELSLKMKVAGASKTLVPICQIIKFHIPEEYV
jgi:hypothetical protein